MGVHDNTDTRSRERRNELSERRVLQLRPRDVSDDTRGPAHRFPLRRMFSRPS